MYKDIPLLEDIDIMRRIRRLGDKIIILKEKSITSDRMWIKKGILFTTVRNLIIQLLFKIGINPKTLYKIYYN